MNDYTPLAQGIHDLAGIDPTTAVVAALWLGIAALCWRWRPSKGR